MASLVPVWPLMILLFTTFYHFGEARIIAVGGSLDAWKVPESPNNTLNHWAEKVRFQVGDTLLFKYDSKIDSVLQVTKENYEKCNAVKPLEEHKDRDTKVKLDVSGPYFFISGATTTSNCVKGEKVTVVVQSPNHHPEPAAPTPTLPPKPSTTPAPPTPTSAPAPAPATSSAVGLVAGNGIFWALIVAVIGLAFV